MMLKKVIKGMLKWIFIMIAWFCIAYTSQDVIINGLNKRNAEQQNQEFQKWQMKYDKLTREVYDKVVSECERQDIYSKVKMINKPANIGKRIVFGIINAESNWERWVRGAAGEYSYMQIMYYNLPKELQKHPEVLFDIDMHFKVGIQKVAEGLDKNDGDIISAVNYFNKGHSKEINKDYLIKIMRSINLE